MEDSIEDKNEIIDCTRKPNDENKNEASTMNNNDALLVNNETPITPLPIDNPMCENTQTA